MTKQKEEKHYTVHSGQKLKD